MHFSTQMHVCGPTGQMHFSTQMQRGCSDPDELVRTTDAAGVLLQEEWVCAPDLENWDTLSA